MKIEPVTYIWMSVYAINFELPEISKKWTLDFSDPNLPQLGLFHPDFVCKSSFRVISMVKMVISDQSKPIYLIFEKKKNQNFKNSKFVHRPFIIHKNRNKTSIPPILKSNSTSFLFNNIFGEIKGKKVIHWRVPGGNGRHVLILSWRCNLSIYLDIHVYYLDIQAITTLLCFILVFMCCFLLFIQFSKLQLLSWKVTCSGTQNTMAPRVLDLQGWD